MCSNFHLQPFLFLLNFLSQNFVSHLSPIFQSQNLLLGLFLPPYFFLVQKFCITTFLFKIYRCQNILVQTFMCSNFFVFNFFVSFKFFYLKILCQNIYLQFLYLRIFWLDFFSFQFFSCTKILHHDFSLQKFLISKYSSPNFYGSFLFRVFSFKFVSKSFI